MGQLIATEKKQRVTIGIPPKYGVLYVLLFLFLLNYSRAAMLFYSIFKLLSQLEKRLNRRIQEISRLF